MIACPLSNFICNYITITFEINGEVLIIMGLRFFRIEKAELVGKDRQPRLHTL